MSDDDWGNYSPHDVKRLVKRESTKSFADYVVLNPFTGCWMWTGSLNGQGYGKVKHGGRLVLAHRLAYDQLVEEIPEGMYIDHLCGCTECCNPEHLEVVTPGENVRRGVERRAPEGMCRKGRHDITVPGIVYVNPSTGQEVCRECRQERARERYATDPDYRMRRKQDNAKSHRKKDVAIFMWAAL